MITARERKREYLSGKFVQVVAREPDGLRTVMVRTRRVLLVPRFHGQ
jgi:hypothetical protein